MKDNVGGRIPKKSKIKCEESSEGLSLLVHSVKRNRASDKLAISISGMCTCKVMSHIYRDKLYSFS